MKSLDDLRSVLSVLPRPFAHAGDLADWSTSPSPMEDGFPAKPTREDMNSFGNLATRELFFRRAGGIHTFDSAVSGGFAEGAVLAHDDGVCIRLVESSAPSNTVDFVSNPAVIDSYSVSGGTSRIWWKTVSLTPGVADGSLSVGIDYSRVQVLGSGTRVAADSLVVIGAMHFENVGASSFGDASSESLSVTIDAEYLTVTDYGVSVSVAKDGEDSAPFWTARNKGLCGVDAVDTSISIFGDGVLYPSKLCGTANFALSFFVEQDATVMCIESTKDSSKFLTTGVYAFPLEVITHDQD